MKRTLLLLGALGLVTGCSKSHQGTSAPPASLNYTPTPAATPVNTSLMVYPLNNDQTSNPLTVKTIDNTYLTYTPGFNSFTISDLPTDQYLSNILTTANYINTYFIFPKVFTASAAYRNYVNINVLPLVGAGDILYDYTGGVIDLPGNGVLTVPPYGFGHVTGSVSFSVNTCYLHPAVKDYLVSLPCYPFADENGKRSFLESYGGYFLATHSANVDFNPAVNVSLQMPIAAAQQATAPDSIPVWDLNTNNTWHRAGYSKRTGNAYTTQITRKGFWNFAIPKDGVYLTLHLRTTTGAPVVNTRITLKTSGGEVADARTDSEGNTVVFIPVNEPVTLDLVNDHYNSWSNISLKGQPLGTFNTAAEQTFTVPDRPDLVTIKGNVFSCDGSHMSNGAVLFSNTNARDNQYVLVKNGNFTMSAWINYAYNLPHITIIDNSGRPLDTTNVVLGSPVSQNESKQYTIDLYGCPNAAHVYCNYVLDTTAYSITGQPGSNGPQLTESNNPTGVDVITIGDNTKGIRFQGYFTSVLGNYFFSSNLAGLSTGLKINGEDCTFQSSSEIAITRQDGIAGGYAEGWFSIHYSDSKNQSHKISGNFRVIRS